MRGVMRSKIIVFAASFVAILVANPLFAQISPEVEEIKARYIPICEPVKNASWDKIEEFQFSKEFVLYELERVKQAYANGWMSANEGLEETIIILTGGAMRLDVDYWENEKPNSAIAKKARETFCEFYRSAYYPH